MKKLLLGLGAAASVIAPIAAVVACGDSDGDKTNTGTTLAVKTDEKAKIETVIKTVTGLSGATMAADGVTIKTVRGIGKDNDEFTTTFSFSIAVNGKTQKVELSIEDKKQKLVINGVEIIGAEAGELLGAFGNIATIKKEFETQVAAMAKLILDEKNAAAQIPSTTGTLNLQTLSIGHTIIKDEDSTGVASLEDGAVAGHPKTTAVKTTTTTLVNALKALTKGTTVGSRTHFSGVATQIIAFNTKKASTLGVATPAGTTIFIDVVGNRALVSSVVSNHATYLFTIML